MFNRKILVVGGEGFIGQTLQRYAFQNKWEVLDLKRGEDVTDGIPDKTYKAIVFLAVNMGRTKSAYDYNESLYKALDDYMQQYPNTPVIYTSSAAVYPDQPTPATEVTPPRPVNLYGKAKLLGECYVQQYRNHTILRLANVHGPGGNGAVDIFRHGGNKIFGTGEAVRDYVSVITVCDAITSAIVDPKTWRGITNVGTGIGYTTLQIFKQWGSGQAKFLKARSGDVDFSVLDSTKMKELL